jgi:predicted permease
MVSEIVVETTFLTVMGGILGLGVAAVGLRLLGHLGADRLPLGAQIAWDGRLAWVALLGSVLLGIVLAGPIAWVNLRSHLLEGLQTESRGGTASRGAQRWRHSFIVAQIALAFVLLVGASLLGLSLKRAMSVSPGFRADHILTGQLSLPGKSYPDSASALAFTERLMTEVGRQPGVLAAGLVNNVPFSGYNGKSAATVKGHVLRPGESVRGSYSYGVSGDYFQAMGFGLRAGRFLNAADSRRGARVCVVDEDFARYYWPNGDALGRLLFQGSEETTVAEAFRVVGVVGRVKQAGLTDEEAQGAVYFPYVFRPANDLFVAVRTSGSPESLALTLRRIVREVDRDLPLTDIQSMETRISDSLVSQRSPALLGGLFSAIAVLLTALGTYGVLSYAVAQRRREIGVRMALGARPQQIGRQFFSLALRLLAGGTILGLIGSWLAGRAMQTVLFHVPAFDLAVLGGAVSVMGLVSLVACLLPSWRAARISPVEALGER